MEANKIHVNEDRRYTTDNIRQPGSARQHVTIGHKQADSVAVVCTICIPTLTVVVFTMQITKTRVIVSDHLNSYPTLSLIHRILTHNTHTHVVFSIVRKQKHRPITLLILVICISILIFSLVDIMVLRL